MNGVAVSVDSWKNFRGLCLWSHTNVRRVDPWLPTKQSGDKKEPEPSSRTARCTRPLMVSRKPFKPSWNDSSESSCLSLKLRSWGNSGGASGFRRGFSAGKLCPRLKQDSKQSEVGLSISTIVGSPIGGLKLQSMPTRWSDSTLKSDFCVSAVASGRYRRKSAAKSIVKSDASAASLAFQLLYNKAISLSQPSLTCLNDLQLRATTFAAQGDLVYGLMCPASKLVRAEKVDQ